MLQLKTKLRNISIPSADTVWEPNIGIPNADTVWEPNISIPSADSVGVQLCLSNKAYFQQDMSLAPEITSNEYLLSEEITLRSTW